MCGEKRQGVLLWFMRLCAGALVVVALLAGLGVSAISVDHHEVAVHSHEGDPLHAAELLVLELLTGATLAMALRRIGLLRCWRTFRIGWAAQAKWWRATALPPGGGVAESGTVLRI